MPSLSTQFITAVSPHFDYANSHADIDDVFSRCYVKHIESSHSTVRQCCILAYPEINQDLTSLNTFTPVARIFLQLRTGLIFGFDLQGNVASGIDKIVDIGAWFCEQQYDELAFDAYEVQLNRLLQSEKTLCTVRILRHAPIAPCASFFLGAMNKICTTLLSFSRTRYSLDKVQKTRAAVVELMTDFSSSESLIAAFGQHLDASVMALLASLNKKFGPNLFRLHIYNYFVAGNPALQRNRMQAVQELPWLTPLLVRVIPVKWRFSALAQSQAEIWEVQQQYWARELSLIIDNGQPLFLHVATLFKVPYATIKWTRHQSLYRDEIFSIERTAQILQILSAIAPVHRPKNRLDWHDLRLIIQPLAIFTRPFSGNSPTSDQRNSHQKAISDVMDDSQAHEILCKRFHELETMKLTLVSGNTWLFDRIINVFDFWKTLRAALKWHCYGYQDNQDHIADGASAFVMRWMESKTLRQLVKISDTWHKANNIAQEKDIAAKFDVNSPANEVARQGWPLVLKAPFTHDKNAVVELANELELIQEGRDMRHCVASYADKCTQEAAVILSIKSKEKSKNATLELMICDQTWQLQIVSLFGVRNEKPSEECQRAATALLDFLNTKAFVEDIKIRRNFQKTQQAINEKMACSKEGQISDYQLMTQHIAWKCAFGTDPTSALPEFTGLTGPTGVF